MQLRETIRDVKTLHNENMVAVAQKKYVYIYDNQGAEVLVTLSRLRTALFFYFRIARAAFVLLFFTRLACFIGPLSCWCG